MKSTRWTVSTLQWLKGLILAIGAPLIVYAQTELPNWTPFLIAYFGKGTPTLQIALGIFLAYIGKSFVTDDVKGAQNTVIKAGGTIITPRVNPQVIND